MEQVQVALNINQNWETIKKNILQTENKVVRVKIKRIGNFGLQ